MSFVLSGVKASDAESLSRNIDVPAMQNGPLYRVMFPGSNSIQQRQLEQIIQWYTDILSDAIQDQRESFLKASTVDGIPVAFCGWTVEQTGGQHGQTRDKQPPTKSNTREERRKNDFLPELLDVEAWVSLSRQLRKERERVLKDLNNICRLTFMSVNPDYQRRGIGSMLMQRVCEEVDLYGRHAYVLAAPEGVRLYAKFGFNIVGHVETPQGTITSMLRPSLLRR